MKFNCTEHPVNCYFHFQVLLCQFMCFCAVGRQWTYQTCTEFGFYQTSNYKPQVFGDRFPIDFFVQQCMDIFGPKYNMSFLNRAVERTNTLYGALEIEVSNVVFVQGSVDPWHALGIVKTIDQGAPAIYIKGNIYSICKNLLILI